MPATNRKLKSRLWLPKQFIIYCYQSSTNILQAKIYFYIVRLTDQFPISAFCEAQRGTNAYPHNMSLVFCNSFGSRRWAKNTQNQIGICAFLIAVRTRECSKVAWQNSDFQLSVRDWLWHEVCVAKTSCFPTVVKALCQTNTTIIQQWKAVNYTWTTRRELIEIQTQNNPWKINKKSF